MKLGTKHSEETKRKIAEKRRGQKLSPEHREKVIKTLQHKSGEQNPWWKGGVSRNGDGYVLILMRHHPKAYSNGYIKMASLIAEHKYGRILNDDEVVHHINGIKDDDRPENIEILTYRQHNSITAKERWESGEMHRILPQLNKEN